MMFFTNTKINSKNNFDFLRFVFALIVVCEHCIILSRNKQLLGMQSWFDTYLAICGFFVISGFLVTKSFLSSKSIRSYFVKRAKRLLPAYYTVIILCTILLSFFSSLSFKDYFLNTELIKYFVSNLLFLNFLHPTLPGVFTGHFIPAVDGALWTIKVEVGFYIILPLIILLTNKWQSFRKALYFLAALYCSSIVFRQFFIFWGEQSHNDLLMDLSHQLPGYLSYFLSGSILFIGYDFFLKRKHLILLIALVIYLIERYFDWEVLRPLALGCIVIYCAFSFSFFNKFGKYGDISYGIYIFHFPIIQMFISLGLYKNHPILAFLGTIIVVCIAGLLSWHLIEKRFLSRNHQLKLQPESN